jgi:hypothetical protein
MAIGRPPYPAVPLARHAPFVCLRRALAQIRPIPPDRRGQAEISNRMLLEKLDRWRRDAGVRRRDVVKALEVGAQRVLAAELLNWVQDRREGYLQRNRRFPPGRVGRDDMVAWWGDLKKLVGRETATARNLVQAFPGQVEERVQEAMAARRQTLAHLDGIAERLGGDALWRLMRVVGGISFELPWYEFSRKEWERLVRGQGLIPDQRHHGGEKTINRILPGFRHRFWVSTVHRLHAVVAGHCENPFAMTYDILTVFFPDWWPTERDERLRDRRKEAARLRAKLRAAA